MAWRKFKRRRRTVLAASDSRWVLSKTRRLIGRRRFWRAFGKKGSRFGANRWFSKISQPVRPAKGRVQLIDSIGEYQTFRISTAHYSFWMQRFFNTLTISGGQKVSQRLVTTALWGLSRLFDEDPVMLVFEFFEVYRYPFLAVQVQRGWSTFVRLTFLPWWRQYLVLIRWFTRSMYSTKVKTSIAALVFHELVLLLSEPSASKTVRRRSLVVAVSAQSRLALHFRWK